MWTGNLGNLQTGRIVQNQVIGGFEQPVGCQFFADIAQVRALGQAIGRQRTGHRTLTVDARYRVFERFLNARAQVSLRSGKVELRSLRFERNFVDQACLRCVANLIHEAKPIKGLSRIKLLTKLAKRLPKLVKTATCFLRNFQLVDILAICLNARANARAGEQAYRTHDT